MTENKGRKKETFFSKLASEKFFLQGGSIGIPASLKQKLQSICLELSQLCFVTASMHSKSKDVEGGEGKGRRSSQQGHCLIFQDLELVREILIRIDQLELVAAHATDVVHHLAFFVY